MSVLLNKGELLNVIKDKKKATDIFQVKEDPRTPTTCQSGIFALSPL